MKKWLTMLLVLVFAITVAACAPTNPQQMETTQSAAVNGITELEAKAMALKDAGVPEAEIRDYEIEQDLERGVWVYEISFEHGGFDYDYHISVENGDILHREKEVDN